MRVLFLSPVHPLLTPGNPLPKWQMQMSWVRGLEKAGAEIKVVKYTPGDGVRLNWADRVWWNLRVISEIQKARLPWFAKGGPSNDRGKFNLIVYSLGADVLLPQTVKLIKWLTGTPLVILSGVSPILNGNPREKATAKLVDLAAVNDENHAEEWIKLGAKKAVILPISAMDPELHWNRGKEDQGDKKDIDVLFVGTLTEERKRFLNNLRKLLPKSINLLIKEFGWEEEYAGLMSRAKIALNPIRSEMAGGANLRMFEIPAFGALELASNGKKEWLMPGKEMLVYKDAEEAVGLIAKYLKDDKRRLEMINRGMRRVKREHTFKERAEKLMEFIKMDFNRALPSGTKARLLVDVSVCIVNYKADKELERCLASISQFTKGINFEVIVIDNSSDNRWYSGGNNLALARAKGRYVLFLNPDCYLTENALAKMVGWMDKHPEVGTGEPRQVYDDGEIAPTGSLLPVWWVDLVELTELSRWFGSVGRKGRLGRLGKISEVRQENLDRRKNWQTEVVSGAAMIVRKRILDEIGGFDEKLKLYYTDVDLCRRILVADYQVWHVGEFKLGHSTGRSTDKIKWDDLYDIYAGDGGNYYSKWGKEFGGKILFCGMKVNKAILRIGHALMTKKVL
ncbi:glycosyltransferase [Candidatus Collierbacteria bacterium]|nr:glycosyltransferase [Candidatus Collierbacteria bacterium]